jgi:MFS family permease
MLVAMLLVAYEAGGALGVGLLGAARTAPAIITGPLTGLLAARGHPARLLRVVHGGRAAASLGLTLWVGLGLPFVGVLALVFVTALAGSLARPLTIAATPSLARQPSELVAANVVMAMGEGIGAFLGPLAAGLVVAVAGPAAAAAVATAVLGVGTVAMLLLRVTGDIAAEIAEQARTSRAAELPSGIRASLRTALVTGPSTLRRLPGAATVIFDFNGQTLVRALSTTLAVVASFELLGLGEAGVGLLGAAFGLGGLIGALGAVGLAGRRRLAPVFSIALSMWGLPFAIVGGAPFAPVALVAYLVSGVANGVLDVAGFTLVQRSSPTAARLSVFGILEASVGATAAIGGLIAPLLIAAFGTQGALGVTGAILPILAVATWPRIKRADDEAQIPDHEVRLLRGIPLFAPLPMTALERIAGSLTPTSHAAGQTIFREGDPGDSYLIIADGEVEVSQAGWPVNRLGAGEGFGEIALLNAVPRTATVTALTATSGYALSGPEFLSAIAGPTSMAAATLIARERLARSAGGSEA